MPKKGVGTSLEQVYRLWGWILLVWSLYRYFFRFPELLDEFFFKPAVFVAPVLWYVLKEEKRTLESVGITTKNLKRSILIGLGFGTVFVVEGVLANMVKYGGFQFNPISVVDIYGLPLLIVLSLATSVWEELLNRGFLFNRIYEFKKNLPYAALLSATMFVFLHVPILVTALKLQGVTLALFFVTNFILGLANSLLFANTGSLVAPVLVHLFWNITVSLFL